MLRYKKIQFIVPPSNRTVEGAQKWARWPQPIGLLSIATYVNQFLPEVEFEFFDYDCVIDMKEEGSTAEIGNADLVGISMTFAQIDMGFELARLVKERGAMVVVGGNIATSLNERILKYHPYIDFCLCYDGEQGMLDLIKGTELSQVPNLVWKDGDKIITNKVVQMDLKTLPIINRDYIDMEAYFAKTMDIEYSPLEYFSRPANMYALKGCSWRAQENGGCLFCSIHDYGLRVRDPRQVWTERQQLVEKYGVNYIWDPSDNFAADPAWLDSLYEARPGNFVVPFSHYIRADFVNQKTLDMLKEMGSVQVFMGMESGSDKALKSLNKNISREIIENALSLLQKNKITAVLGLVIGAKNESQETILETLYFIKYLLEKYECLDRFEWGTLVPLPGSRAFKQVMEHPELGEKYKDFGKGNIMSMIEQMTEDWPDYMCQEGVDFEYFLHVQQLAQEHLPYRMTRYQKRAWCGNIQKVYHEGQLVTKTNY